MIPVTSTVTGVGSTAWVQLNPNVSPSQLTVACVVSGTATYSVQYAYDSAHATAWNDNVVVGLTGNAIAVLNDPVSWARITISSGTGSVTGTFLQSGYIAPGPNVPVGPTGQYKFGSIYASDLMYDVYERLGWRAASLTPDMMLSAQRSFNFVQTRWSNLGVNLWEVSLESITLAQGVASYTIDAATIDVLPSAYIRIWNLSDYDNVTPAFTTVSGSTSVSVNLPSNGLLVGNYINVSTPVAVGGTIVFGYYPVVSTPDPNTITLTTALPAASSTTGGVVPTFTTDGSTAFVTVALANQPFLAGQTFNVQVQTVVGGLTLLGQYLITQASTNSFVIQATVNSTSVATVTMNGGLAQIQSQPAAQNPTDRVLYPMSRPDYSALSVKLQQGSPTSFWFDRTTIPTITFWPVADQNGPYEFQYYKLSQMQDASIQSGHTLDIPYRFMEAYAAACAAHLAIKWRPEVAKDLMLYAQQVWQEASDADREKVSTYISPDFSGYFS